MNIKSNSDRLGEEPIAKLLLRLSVPSAVGLILITSYNLVDTIFIGRLGVNAISALSIAFPIQMILAGIAIGTGVGTQSLISRSLGKKQQMKASMAAGNSILLAVFLGFITLIIGQFFSENIIRLFVSDTDVINLGAAYLRIILLGSFSLFYLRAGINILRAQGNYLLPMFILILTASLNIVLDPLLIFGLWGCSI
jgi:Na+-driven multidrug efflux pump